MAVPKDLQLTVFETLHLEPRKEISTNTILRQNIYFGSNRYHKPPVLHSLVKPKESVWSLPAFTLISTANIGPASLQEASSHVIIAEVSLLVCGHSLISSRQTRQDWRGTSSVLKWNLGGADMQTMSPQTIQTPLKHECICNWGNHRCLIKTNAVSQSWLLEKGHMFIRWRQLHS